MKLKVGEIMQVEKLTLKDVATTMRQYLETIFALGDGHVGVRDSLPFTGNQQGTLPVMLVNGFYASNPITYGENAYGYAKNHQTIVSLTSPRYLDFATAQTDSAVPDDWHVTVDDTVLDFNSGKLTEKFQITTSDQHHFELTVESLILLDDSHQLMLNYQLTSLDYAGELRFKRPIVREANAASEADDDPRVAQRQAGLKIEFKTIADEQELQWQTTVASTQQQLTQSDRLTAVPANFSVHKDQTGFHGAGEIKPHETLQWSFIRQVSEINQPLATSSVEDAEALNQRIFGNNHKSKSVITNYKRGFNTIYSSSSSQLDAMDSPILRLRGSLVRVMKAIISGILKCICCHSSSTRSRKWPSNYCTIATVFCHKRANVLVI